ncbi:hypothetical protein [Mesorhizobium sp. CAU 1732]|uniref:hypothetical protein n=1 Tax=Mesorhizobium sp. CAU 1732 TaxID=3140358 RepID=UPI003260FBE9
MNKLILRTSLAALLVSVPMAGAFADSNSNRDAAAGIGAAPLVDTMSTASIRGVSTASSNWQVLETQLNAAQTNLAPTSRGEGLDAAAVNQFRSQIDTIRQSAKAEAQSNGGQLSESSYRAYSAQVRAIQDNIYAQQG